MWKRTIYHWLFFCIVSIGIIFYLLFNNADGNGLTPSSALFFAAILGVATIAFFLAGRLIRNTVRARCSPRPGSRPES
jgi:hypothetical protein